MKRRFWCFRHQANNEDWEMVEKSLLGKYVCMQYEYGIQDNRKVPIEWNNICRIKEGDIIFLQGSSKVYAWGRAIKPRMKTKYGASVTSPITLKVKDIVDARDHGQYRSDKSTDYIVFEDAELFYENLEDGKESWGQRIDVDAWNDFYSYGVPYKFDNSMKQGLMEVIKEISIDSAKEYIKNLVISNISEMN